MPEYLINLDRALFYIINNDLQNLVFDVIMPFLTNLDNWRIPLALAWLALMIWGGKKGRMVGVLAVLTLTLSDQTSGHLLKPLFGRLRPCNALENVHLLMGCTGSFSFPSCHATNTFAIASLFSYFYKRYTAYFFAVAILVGYSRIYVGVHYPLDVLGGFFLGFLCAEVMLFWVKPFVVKLVEKITSLLFSL